jgi:hypothetical protein
MQKSGRDREWIKVIIRGTIAKAGGRNVFKGELLFHDYKGHFTPELEGT